jgi:hypothetical protein
MFQSRRIAIKALGALLLCCASTLALAAQVAGTVVNLSGALLAKKENGTVKVLALKSEVEQGDTLVSEKNSYARIRFVDNSEVTLKPNTSFKIDAFSYEAGKPEADSAGFTMLKGGLRSVTGMIGKRNREKFQLRTPTATIGIRGTVFGVQWVEAGAASLPGEELLKPGLHVRVVDGAVNVSNGAGAQVLTAGQFGFVGAPDRAPVVVPANPGMTFTPPPSFTSVETKDAGKPLEPAAAIDCEVR